MYAEEYSVYTTTINFPCIRTLVVSMKSHPGADTGYRIQDLSEGGARFILEPKIQYLGSQRRDAGKKILR